MCFAVSNNAVKPRIYKHKETVMIAYRHLKSWAKTVLSQYPCLVQPYVRLFHRDVSIGPNTDIVIEGFPRSANSYANDFMLLSQPRALTIAHHLHMPGQLILGVRQGIPVIALVRHPRDAVTSTCIYHGFTRPTLVLKAFIRFYRPLMKYRDAMVIGDFETVTTDFNRIIRKLNAKYGGCFAEVDSRLTSAAVFKRIEDANRTRNDPTKIHIPSETRRLLVPRVQERVEASPYYEHAVKVYEQFLANER